MSRLRRAVIIAVVVGVAAGSAFAILHRQSAAPPVTAVGELDYRPPAQKPLHLGALRDIRVDNRTADPAGGPPWALRTFGAGPGGDPRHPGTWRCVQLGRVLDGDFGWIAPGQAFRRAGPNQSDAPTMCSPAAFLRRGSPAIARIVLLSGARLAQGAPESTITWGELGRPLASVVLSDGTQLVPSDARGVLRIRAGDAPSWNGGSALYRDGHRRVFHRVLPAPRYPLDSTAVAARAPDPAGGPPWAVLHPRGAPRTCLLGPGRLVGRHIGVIDAHLGTFLPDVQPSNVARSGRVLLDGYVEPVTGACPHPAPRLTSSRPAAIDYRVVFLHDEDPVGRVQLREPDGRTIAFGATRANVTAVTLLGDRTLVPSPAAHAVISVQAGTSPAGDFSIGAHLRDGRNLYWPLRLSTG